jgi:hypothetical protein
MGSVAGTLVCRWRVGTKHGRAEVGTIPISTKKTANADDAEHSTNRRSDDGS